MMSVLTFLVISSLNSSMSSTLLELELQIWQKVAFVFESWLLH